MFLVVTNKNKGPPRVRVEFGPLFLRHLSPRRAPPCADLGDPAGKRVSLPALERDPLGPVGYASGKTVENEVGVGEGLTDEGLRGAGVNDEADGHLHHGADSPGVRRRRAIGPLACLYGVIVGNAKILRMAIGRLACFYGVT